MKEEVPVSDPVVEALWRRANSGESIRSVFMDTLTALSDARKQLSLLNKDEARSMN